MSKQTIACIGQGFVGGSLTTVFSERGFNVAVFDKAGKKAQGAYEWTLPELEPKSLVQLVNFTECMEDLNFTGVYFMCLPTPMKSDGSCDVSILESVLTELSSIPKGPVLKNKDRIVVVKSTVPPGTVENWNKTFNSKGLYIVFNPEFLREASALEDMRNQDRIILGGPRPQINVVRDVFKAAFPDVPIVKTSSVNAEFVKYVTNTFLATKVSFANEIYQICEKLAEKGLDIDYDRIIECATLDKRLGTSHWKVPGPVAADDGSGRYLRGYSCSCFPKDTNALIHMARELGVDPKVLSAGWEKNLEVRPERDWEKLVGRAISDVNVTKK